MTSQASDVQHSGVESAVSPATMPIIMELPSRDTDPILWVGEQRENIAATLDRHGAVLFRDMSVNATTLRNLVCAVSSVATFAEESSPRSRVAQDVLTSTDYPAAYPIQFHNEFSYGASWPMKLFFCCLQPADAGGETPIADCRRVLANLSSRTQQRFRDLGVLYRRNYFDFMGVTWKKAFNTSSKPEVDRYCANNGIKAVWESSDTLRTEAWGHAIVKHPRTGEDVWFNHGFFFNVRAIEPEQIRNAVLAQPEFSTNTYFGDGSAIDAETIEEIREAYRRASVEFQWKRGDVLLIDNMMVAHSRRPFSGQRRIVVSMGDAFERSMLTQSSRTQ